MSCTKQVKALPYNEEESEFLTRANNFWITHFPYDDLKAKHQWELYLLSKSLFGHYSLMLQCKTKPHCFFVELVKEERDDGLLQVSLHIRKIDHNDVKKKELTQTPLGNLKMMSAEDILLKAHLCLKKMGAYQACVNNCQNYCEDLAKELGCDSNAILTIGDASALASAGTIITILASAILFMLIGSK